MSTEANKLVIRDFFAALSNGEAERVRELLHKDVIWTIIGGTPVSRTFNGIEDFETGIPGPVFQQIDAAAGVSVDILELIAEGDKVVARAEGKIKGKYGPWNNTYCHVFTVRDGKIIDDTEYLDTVLIERSLYGKSLAG